MLLLLMAPSLGAQTALAAPPARAAEQGGQTVPPRDGNGMNTAPAGLLPAHWRGVRSIDRDALDRARREARAGQLDPFAFVEEVFGPVPLPSGFRPARCLDRAHDMIFTSGRSVSAEYDRWMADYTSGGDQMGKPSFLLGHQRMARQAMAGFMAEMEAFYLEHGFRRTADNVRIGRKLFVPADAASGSLAIQLELSHEGYMEGLLCHRVDPIPSGPVIRLRIRPVEQPGESGGRDPTPLR
ncbi:hypothetical protein ACMGDM_19910 [Sphingomonas sp. DT-51]|uniref:hypothetical protein n=1 Tax=Sphingomonas sp. DT-51 TaxID=3396165 RepID=UPI003F1B1F4F